LLQQLTRPALACKAAFFPLALNPNLMGEYATGKAEISSQEPNLIAKGHRQVVLERGIVIGVFATISGWTGLPLTQENARGIIPS
jgi:hypothetical protein